MDIGWSFTLISASGSMREVNPTMTGSISLDLSREVRRTLTGLTFLPEEYAKFTDLASDRLQATLILDGVDFPIGVFFATEANYQPDVLLDPTTGETVDLWHISFGCGTTRLSRSDELTRQLQTGADPSQYAISLVIEAGLNAAIAGSVSPMKLATVWGAGTPFVQMVDQLGDLAGHRRGWCDNDGIYRSVAAVIVIPEVIPLADLGIEAGTLLITESFLSAPNRVLVVDDQSTIAPVTGLWEAPAVSPNSVTRRGYPRTIIVPEQGLAGTVHAVQIAETIGETLNSRSLTGSLLPTARLDGPTVLSYRGSLWLCESWSLATAPGSRLTFQATELL